VKRAVECDRVWKQYGARARGVKEVIVGPRRKLEGRYSRRWALQDISFEVERGKAFGVVGHNGSGKTTLLALLLGTLKPDKGRVETTGRVASLLELGAGFHPELTGKENILLYGAILGMSLGLIGRKLDEIVAFSELENAVDNPIRTYSSGMIARLGFSTIIHAEADILLIDEVLAVGDSRFQMKCKEYLKSFKKNGGTLVIASHDMEVLKEMCDGGMRLDSGVVMEEGSISEIVAHYEESLEMK